MAYLAEHHYGKSLVRLMKVTREGERHEVREWSVGVYLRGSFDESFVTGENARVLPTDTMKNTVYSVARSSHATTMEEYALELAEFLLRRNAQVSSVEVRVEEKTWARMEAAGKEHGSAFQQRGPERPACTVVLRRDEVPEVRAGVEGIVLLKTSRSGFSGFMRDELTTLRETEDRLLGTEASIEWLYGSIASGFDFQTIRAEMMKTLLTAFAEHESASVQHTLYAMAEAALASQPSITEISLTMPNRHCLLVDLSRFGQENPNEIFVPTDEPHGHIHARVTRERQG